ncbi:MAG: metallophosphoesterase [Rikenellaceae bacterium]
MRKRGLILFVVIFLFVVGCGMIEYHPYDGQTDIENVNSSNIELIVNNTKGKEEFKFVWMGDTQRCYDETKDFVSYVNENLDVDFVMLGGDISDFGTTVEFELIHEIMDELDVPYVALIGNHDVLGTGHYVFEQMYGDDNFSFTVADVKFLCLNTNALEYDEEDDVPNFEYVSNELAKSDNAARTIVAMHARPCTEQLDSVQGEMLHNKFKEFNNLICCVNAHGHSTEVVDVFDDGVLYYQCSNIGQRSFSLFSITKTDYSYEEIYF